MQTGIGPATVDKIIRQIQELDSLENADDISDSLSVRAKIGWRDFLSVWNDLSEVDSKNPAVLIKTILESKYQDYLEAEYPDYRERMQDIEQLAIFADRSEDLSRFLGEASLQESYTARYVRADNIDDEERIILSTIHQAKGLEWKAVFIINLSSGQFPNERAMREMEGIEEERRLFYVAVTRAKKHLHMTYPLMGGFSSYLAGPSMFLDEIDRNLVDMQEIGGGVVFTDPSDDIDDITYENIDSKTTTSFLRDISDL